MHKMKIQNCIIYFCINLYLQLLVHISIGDIGYKKWSAGRGFDMPDIHHGISAAAARFK